MTVEITQSLSDVWCMVSPDYDEGSGPAILQNVNSHCVQLDIIQITMYKMIDLCYYLEKQ